MRFKFKLPEPNSPEIEIEYSLWWGTKKAFVHGKEIARLKERDKPFPIPMPNSSIKVLAVLGVTVLAGIGYWVGAAIFRALVAPG
jgi:hypothetical protein